PLSAAPHTSPAAPAVPAVAAAWIPRSRRSDNCTETAGAWRADRSNAGSRQNGAFPLLSKAVADARSNILRRKELLPAPSAAARWSNCAPASHRGGGFPVECPSPVLQAENSLAPRHQADFFPQEPGAAAA